MKAKRKNARAASSAVCTLFVLWAAGLQAQESAGVQSAGAAAPDATALATLRRARDAQIGSREFDNALKSAKDVVAAQQQAPHDIAYATDVAALARVHAELRDSDAAETRYLEAIDIISKAEGEFSPTLVDVYRGLGRSYIRSARYPQAITTLETAQNISQRNLGLFNVEQSPLLDDMTTAYLGLGDTIEAQKRQLDRLDNAIRRFGADDPRVFPFRYVLANYYEHSRLPESASKQYEEVLKSQEKTRGDADASLMAPLRQMVKLDLLVTQATKAEHRDRLAALVSEHADADPIERGLSFAVLGDWAIVANDGTGARDYYKQAWTSITQNPQFDVAGYFSAPSMIDFVAPLSSVDQNLRSRPYAWGQIQFNFNVAPDGLPANVTIVGLGDDQEPTLIQSQYNRRLRETHFRPRLVAGEPVLTANVKSTHYYRYYLEKEKKEKKSRNKAKGRDEEEPAAEKSKG